MADSPALAALLTRIRAGSDPVMIGRRPGAVLEVLRVDGVDVELWSSTSEAREYANATIEACHDFDVRQRVMGRHWARAFELIEACNDADELARVAEREGT